MEATSYLTIRGSCSEWKRPKIDWLEIRWPQPSGAVERLTNVPLDEYVTIVEGQGIVRQQR